MENFAALWASFDLRKRFTIVGAGLAVFVAVALLGRTATSPNMELLYAGLAPDVAGEVVSALEARGVGFEIRQNAIYVPQSARDRLRMELAAEGVPRPSGGGYEILEQMTGFGTTSQMFDAAYWRAKEGELARTILSSPNIKTARVHIARDARPGFGRRSEPSASVSVTAQSGQISQTQANSIQHLVAAAVPNLSSSKVSIIDAISGEMLDQTKSQGAQGQERASLLKARVERLLQARLGGQRAVVEVSVETVTIDETFIERSIDPNSRVVISTDSQESSQQSEGTQGGGVTVASNLPEGDGAGGDKNSSREQESRERVNYDVSQTERQVRSAPGAIKRITVAVLVDGLRTVAANGEESWAPLSQDELTALTDLVKAAVGASEARGDVVTLKSMPLEAVTAQGTLANSAPDMLGTIDLNRILMMALILAGLLIGLRVLLRPMLQAAPAQAALPSPDLPELPNLEAGSLPALDLPKMNTVTNFDIPISNDNGMIALPDLPQIAPLLDSVKDDTEDPVERLKKLIEERSEETIEVLRSWISEKKEEV